MIAAIFALVIEPERTVVREVEVTSPNWHGAPIKIALVSDIHYENFHVTLPRIEKTGKLIQSLSPDIIFLGGDYFGNYFSLHQKLRATYAGHSEAENARVKTAMRAIGDYAKYAPLGAVAIMGNHDRLWSEDETRKAFAQTKTPLLQDKILHIKNDKFDFWVCGIEDRANWHGVTSKVCDNAPKGADVLTLVHNPMYFFPFIGNSKIEFSGHLHGGQVRLPIIGALKTSGPFTRQTTKGYMIDKDRILLETSGIGMSGLPMRFNVPPEIMIINLKSGSETAAKSQIKANYWSLN